MNSNYKSYPVVKQKSKMSCGTACLKMISNYYKIPITYNTIEKYLEVTEKGTTIQKLVDVAKIIGFNVLPAKTNFSNLKSKIPLPCIAYWNKNKHFVVVYEVNDQFVRLADPMIDRLIDYTQTDFITNWTSKKNKNTGICILFELNNLSK